MAVYKLTQSFCSQGSPTLMKLHSCFDMGMGQIKFEFRKKNSNFSHFFSRWTLSLGVHYGCIQTHTIFLLLGISYANETLQLFTYGYRVDQVRILNFCKKIQSFFFSFWTQFLEVHYTCTQTHTIFLLLVISYANETSQLLRC